MHIACNGSVEQLERVLHRLFGIICAVENLNFDCSKLLAYLTHIVWQSNTQAARSTDRQ